MLCEDEEQVLLRCLHACSVSAQEICGVQPAAQKTYCWSKELEDNYSAIYGGIQQTLNTISARSAACRLQMIFWLCCVASTAGHQTVRGQKRLTWRPDPVTLYISIRVLFLRTAGPLSAVTL